MAITEQSSYLDRVYDRLENQYDVQAERRILEALVDLKLVVEDVPVGCIGENDIRPVLYGDRPEPGHCDCRISADEANAIRRASREVRNAVQDARRLSLSAEQRTLLSVRAWQEAGFNWALGLPVTTVDLIDCATYVVLQARWIRAGVRRADVADNIKELQRELA